MTSASGRMNGLELRAAASLAAALLRAAASAAMSALSALSAATTDVWSVATFAAFVAMPTAWSSHVVDLQCCGTCSVAPS